MRDATPQQAREAIASGEYTRSTAGVSIGFVQANLAVVPGEYADDFAGLCAANPRPLPLIERLDAGRSAPVRCAEGADIRTALGSYSVYDGSTWTPAQSLVDVWRDDAVSFVLGCSFTAEQALLDAGVTLDHLDHGLTVPMYRTTSPLNPAGRLGGHLVVSMRAIAADEVDETIRVTALYPVAHGAPVLVGPGEELGCRDGRTPDWGDALEVRADRVPMYWACGVTPQTVIEESGLPWAFVHAPGHMLVTDLPDANAVDREPGDLVVAAGA